MDEAITMVEDNGDASYMPELLRMKANVLMEMGLRKDAEDYFMRALELSRNQSALAWELRIATDLADCWSAAGECARARDFLKSIFDRFTEGQQTADVKAAEYALAALA